MRSAPLRGPARRTSAPTLAETIAAPRVRYRVDSAQELAAEAALQGWESARLRRGHGGRAAGHAARRLRIRRSARHFSAIRPSGSGRKMRYRRSPSCSLNQCGVRPGMITTSPRDTLRLEPPSIREL